MQIDYSEQVHVLTDSAISYTPIKTLKLFTTSSYHTARLIYLYQITNV